MTRKADTAHSERVSARRWKEQAEVGAAVLPTAALLAVAYLLAWREHGSVAARHWLPYAVVVLLVLATVLFAGLARRPSRSAVVVIAALAALAAWSALSLLWSPLPGLARDEGLLVAVYAASFAVPALTLPSGRSRIAALGTVVAALGALTLATALELRFGSGQLEAFYGKGRLYFPVGYVNAEAAVALVAFWPAVVLAGRRAGSVPARSLSLGAASLMLAVALLTQSRGGAIALALSVAVALAVLPARLRLLVPVAVPVALTALAFRPLTAPFGATGDKDPGLAGVIRDAAEASLLVGAAGVVVGVAYALVDRRVEVLPGPRRAAGIAALAAAAACLVAGAAVFVAQVDEPRSWASERWDAFKQEPETEEARTHFLNPGSNRYDYWRVALLEFRDHPVRGAGARSFGPAYLVRGRSAETPARAHSLVFEQLSENGLVGLSLLAAALAAAFAGLARSRALVPAAGALAAAVYWTAHAGVDWLWTFPASGIPLFVLLGIGLARDAKPLPRRPALAGATAVLLVAAAAFVPPWLATRYADQGAREGLPAGAGDFDRARALDPLNVEPLLVRSQLARTAEERIGLLRQAVEQEPGAVRNQYLLGLALLDAGRTEEAREALDRAHELYPRSPDVAAALARSGG